MSESVNKQEIAKSYLVNIVKEWGKVKLYKEGSRRPNCQINPEKHGVTSSTSSCHALVNITVNEIITCFYLRLYIYIMHS